MIEHVTIIVNDKVAVCDCVWISEEINECACISCVDMYRRILRSAVLLIVPCSDSDLDLRAVIIVLGNSKALILEDIDLSCLILAPDSESCRTACPWTSEVHITATCSHEACELTCEEVTGCKHSYNGVVLAKH